LVAFRTPLDERVVRDSQPQGEIKIRDGRSLKNQMRLRLSRPHLEAQTRMIRILRFRYGLPGELLRPR
jgi:hypothetical protein